MAGSPVRSEKNDNRISDSVLAIVDELDHKLSFKKFLLNVRQTLLDAYTHQFYPFERLVRDFGLEYVKNKCPFFDIALVLTNIHGNMPEVKNDITMTFTKEEKSISGRIEFSAGLFKPESIERFSNHFTNLLREGLENKNVLIGELQLLTRAEQHQMLVEWNNTRKPYPDDMCMHELFESQVEQDPDATAVVFKGKRLSYRELNARANQLARYLQISGVGPEVLVGICVDRSIEMIVGVLGILKAGGAYVPLDPDYPKDRLAFMLGDSQISLLLTIEDCRLKLEASIGNRLSAIVSLDTDWPV